MFAPLHSSTNLNCLNINDIVMVAKLLDPLICEGITSVEIRTKSLFRVAELEKCTAPAFPANSPF